MMDAGSNPDVKVVQTNEGVEDGQNKCPKCGATDIAFNMNTSMLRCNFCRFEFQADRAVGLDTDLSKLEGKVVGAGATEIAADAESIITLKCSSCAAEVVIDTDEAVGARCHWCRNTLSIAQQVPNGAVPDMVLPFRVPKDQAQTAITSFVKKRRFFAHPRFKAEFCTENIMGVYMPFMLVGINSQAHFSGQGERLIRKRRVGTGRNQRTVYDADLYEVDRKFDLVIDGLPIISSSERLGGATSGRTDNIINAIKPFDHENCVKWDANYLKGIASEKRDTNIEDLKRPIETKAKDVARHRANETIREYDRGVRWRRQDLAIKGQQWKASYLPIWLYSYQQKKSGGQSLLHYVAVNARSRKTMGSVPVNKLKLFLFSLVVQIFGTVAGLFLAFFAFDEPEAMAALALLLSGFLYYSYYYMKYRNTRARFEHEKDAKSTISNVTRRDQLIKRLNGLSNSRMRDANNMDVNYSGGGSQSGIGSLIDEVKSHF